MYLFSQNDLFQGFFFFLIHKFVLIFLQVYFFCIDVLLLLFYYMLCCLDQCAYYLGCYTQSILVVVPTIFLQVSVFIPGKFHGILNQTLYLFFGGKFFSCFPSFGDVSYQSILSIFTFVICPFLLLNQSRYYQTQRLNSQLPENQMF